MAGFIAWSLIGCTGGEVRPTKIFFSSDRDGQFAIFVMDGNGDDVTRLTDPAISCDYPAASRDGAKIVFIGLNGGQYDIYTMTSDGSKQVRLTNDAAIEQNPSFSYDGSQITFSSDAGGRVHVYRMDTDGSNRSQVTQGQFDNFAPRFSPSGAKIAFFSQRGFGTEVFLVNTDGSGEEQVSVNENTWDAWPCFTHDGQAVLMSEYDPLKDTDKLVRLNLATRATTVLHEDVGSVFNVSLASDGRHVAYALSVAGNTEIALKRIGSSTRQILTNHAADDQSPSFGD
ncbi:MAG: DUF5050 domain-containing protein [Armatimonadota bacterium]|nr:DUF5050 domain-containing protein [Armatimonadota bacterium]